MKSRFRIPITFLITCMVFTACGGNEAQGPLEVTGTWSSNFGFDETITDGAWGAATVVTYDNADNYVVAQQPADDMFNPSKFSKIVWTEPSAGGAFYYCTVDFGLATAAEAEGTTKSADASDPANSGCGGFSWTRLAAPIEIAGEWSSMFGMESVSSHEWGTTAVLEYDNAANWVISQNAADDLYNPSKFNKVVWTEPSAGRFFYCWVDFGRDTLEQAKTSTQSANDSNPSVTGCGAFPWTELSSN